MRARQQDRRRQRRRTHDDPRPGAPVDLGQFCLGLSELREGEPRSPGACAAGSRGDEAASGAFGRRPAGLLFELADGALHGGLGEAETARGEDDVSASLTAMSARSCAAVAVTTSRPESSSRAGSSRSKARRRRPASSPPRSVRKNPCRVRSKRAPPPSASCLPIALVTAGCETLQSRAAAVTQAIHPREQLGLAGLGRHGGDALLPVDGGAAHPVGQAERALRRGDLAHPRPRRSPGASLPSRRATSSAMAGAGATPATAPPLASRARSAISSRSTGKRCAMRRPVRSVRPSRTSRRASMPAGRPRAGTIISTCSPRMCANSAASCRPASAAA